MTFYHSPHQEAYPGRSGGKQVHVITAYANTTIVMYHWDNPYLQRSAGRCQLRCSPSEPGIFLHKDLESCFKAVTFFGILLPILFAITLADFSVSLPFTSTANLSLLLNSLSWLSLILFCGDTLLENYSFALQNSIGFNSPVWGIRYCLCHSLRCSRFAVISSFLEIPSKLQNQQLPGIKPRLYLQKLK